MAAGQPNPTEDVPGHGGAADAKSGSIIAVLLCLHHLARRAGKRCAERRGGLERDAETLRYVTDRAAELLLRDELQDELLDLVRHELDQLLNLLQLRGHDLQHLLKLLLLGVRELLQLLNLLWDDLQPLGRRLLAGV